MDERRPDYFTTLAARSLGRAAVVRPRLPSRFEPVASVPIARFDAWDSVPETQEGPSPPTASTQDGPSTKAPARPPSPQTGNATPLPAGAPRPSASAEPHAPPETPWSARPEPARTDRSAPPAAPGPATWPVDRAVNAPVIGGEAVIVTRSEQGPTESTDASPQGPDSPRRPPTPPGPTVVKVPSAPQHPEFAVPSRSTERPRVQVFIGRIEVRAEPSEAPPTPVPKTARPAPRMSLDDYLRDGDSAGRRGGGGRP